MSETQNIEYKTTWRDEYLKWICGFANANGGTIFIGKDDNGKIVGVPDAKKLLEEIPNKVRDVLGILVDVNLHTENKKQFIEIITEPYPNGVSYKGQYHYRSGSTKQELKGAALDKFILQKKGKRWDGVLVPSVSVSDLKQETFDFFKKRGIRSKRLSEENLIDTNEQILDNLELKEKQFLKRAALLLFHPKPEKFVTGAFIKIGFFENDADLIFQDEVDGNLFEQIEKAIDLLFTKYIKAFISYENGINRVETYEYPKDAIREALLNAIAHKDYSGGVPIQISVYKDKIMIWNEGQLPEDWTIETLIAKHSSKPYNPDIALAFYRSGYIESWGRGITKMTDLCVEAGLPKPTFYYKSSGIWAVFQKDILNAEYLQTLGLNDRQVKAVLFAKDKGKITNSEYQELNDIKKSVTATELQDLTDKGILVKVGSTGRGTKYILPNK
ncbi:MAG: putative DNA binding domain-containing protein [Cyclobacteriaceae bacterium]|nr:putative DNA binding domain-containing protein [Cyclobacteriaceae bacterium]